MKPASTIIAVLSLAGLITASTASTQDRVDLTRHNVTAKQLIGALTLKFPDRGVWLKDAKVNCRPYYRGVQMVTPAAAIAAIKVEFASGSAELTPAGEKTLSTLGEALGSDELSHCCFQIGGYTDSTGRLSYNEKLSQRRAQSVVAYLAANSGIDSARIVALGYGPKNPIGDNTTPEGRAQNRRVEVMNRGYGTTS